MPKKGSATKGRNFRTFLLVRQFAQKEIGERIALARKEAGGMTQEQLGELLNVTTRSVQDYEAGVTVPWKYFQLLEEIFKRQLGWFLHGEEGDGVDASKEQLEALVARFERIAQQLEEVLGNAPASKL